MHSVSSRILTRVAMSISYDDNDYTTGTSMYLIMMSVKQGVFKYHFLSLCLDSTRDRTPISQAISEYFHVIIDFGLLF